MTKNGKTINAVVTILIISVLIFINTKQIYGEDMENVVIQSLNVDHSKINIGDVFSINTSILNNSNNTISIHNNCRVIQVWFQGNLR